jgi:hypothetical protein
MVKIRNITHKSAAGGKKGALMVDNLVKYGMMRNRLVTKKP